MAASSKKIIRRAAARTPGKKKKGGLKRDERANIANNLGAETNPNDLWRRSTVPQRRRWKRTAKKRGVTVQGLLSGGPSGLQERSTSGMRKQARRDVDLAYKPAEQELNDREVKARNLSAKEQSDADRFDLWMAGEQAKLETSAKGADEALRSRYDAIAAAQNTGFDQGGADDAAGAATQGYADQQIGLARTAAQGATGAAAREAERAMASASRQRGSIAQSVNTANVNRRYELDEKFHNELREIGQERKTLGLTKAADAAKEMSRLRDQRIEVGQANREARMLGDELGIKAYEAKSDRISDAATNRLNWKKYKADLNDDQVRRALDRVKVQIAAGTLDRQERADAERARHNLQTELNERMRIKQGGKGGGHVGPDGKPWSEGAKNRWGTVVNLQSISRYKRPQGTSNLLWEASRAMKRTGGLTYDLYQRLVQANVAVPANLRPRPNSGTGPH